MKCGTCGQKYTDYSMHYYDPLPDWEDFFAIMPVTIDGKRYWFKTIQRQAYGEYYSGIEFGHVTEYNYRIK